MTPVLEILRHEVVSAARSRRLWLVSALYLGGATVGGLTYAWTLNKIREAAVEGLMKAGQSAATASLAISMAATKGYKEMVAGLAGIDVSLLNPDFEVSVMMPALLWGALAFLPFLVVFSAFDHVASDLQARSLNFNVLRVSRSELLAGKTLAWALVMGVLLLLGSICLLLAANQVLVVPVPVETFGLAIKYALLLLPFLVAYLAMTTAASTLFARPFTALAGSLGIMFVFFVLGVVSKVSDSHASLGALSHLRWLTPGAYHDGFWQSGWKGPLTSMFAYLVMGGLFYALADRRLRTRDL
jgi:ABC-type transport system involved in multi-copper enzyme maturation permease subunit